MNYSTRKVKKWTYTQSLLLTLLVSVCVSEAQANSGYSCISNSAIKMTCGYSSEYVGDLQSKTQAGSAPSVASATLKSQAVVQGATVYSVQVKSAGQWCFNVSGDKSSVHGLNKAPILEGQLSSLAVLAGPNQRVSTNPTGASFQLCSGSPNQNITDDQANGFYLLVGTPQEIVHLVQTPSAWLTDSKVALNKVVDKSSPIVKRNSYFMVDLSEKNSPEILNLAKQGDFPYILIYAWTWANTLGSYEINKAAYPHGIDGLIAVSKQANQFNIKLGLHTLTALVSKNDPLASSSHGLLKKNNELVNVDGDYVLDLKDDLRYAVAGHIADVVNKVSPGMVYFDGGELSGVAGDPSYDTAELQIDTLGLISTKVLVQGSVVSPRLWPYMSRMSMGDYAALAPIEYLDSYKIAQSLPLLSNNLMPAELGWIGIVAETPSYPATTVEDISTYMARTLALGLPFSVETRQIDLDTNPYTLKLFRAIGAANRSLQAGDLSAASKNTLSVGKWYFVDGDHPYFAKLSLKQQHIVAGESLVNLGVVDKNASSAMLRISSVHSSNDENVIPLSSTEGIKIEKLKNIDASNRGLLASRIKLSGVGGGLDLIHARSMSIDYTLSSTGVSDSSSCSILNAQLEDNKGSYRDYYLALSAKHAGPAIISYLDAPAQMYRGLTPNSSSYRAAAATYNFDFSNVVAVNFRWMKTCNTDESVTVKNIKMVKELPATLNSIQLLIGNTPILNVPALKTGETLDVFPNGSVTICQLANCKQVGNVASFIDAISNQSFAIKTQGNAAYDLSFGVLTSKVPL